MKWQAIAREMWRDVVTGTAWTATFALLAAVACYGLLSFDLVTITRMNDQATQYQATLASVHVIAAPKHVDPAACTALNDIPEIRAAVAIRAVEEDARALALPGTTISTYESAGPIATLLRAPMIQSNTGIVLSEQAAAALNVTSGSPISLDRGDTSVQAVFPWDEHDGRRVGYAYSLFIPTPASGFFDECWFDVWPSNEQVQQLALTALLPSSDPQGPQVEHYSLNSSKGASFDGQQLFLQRTTYHAAVAAAGIAFLLGGISIWRRRLEIASDMHAGVTRRDETLKLMGETASHTLAAPSLAAPVITWIITANGSGDRVALWTLTGWGTIAIITATFAGALTASLLIKEKYLFIYFKRR